MLHESENQLFLAFIVNPRVRTALFLCVVSLAGGTLWSVFPGLFGALLLIMSFLIIIISLIVVLFGAGSALFGKKWQLLSERIILLVVIIPILTIAPRLGDYVHLAILYPYYRQKIRQTSKRPVEIIWGDQALSALDGTDTQVLLFDETGLTTVTSTEERDDQDICTSRRRLFLNFFIESIRDCR